MLKGRDNHTHDSTIFPSLQRSKGRLPGLQGEWSHKYSCNGHKSARGKALGGLSGQSSKSGEGDFLSSRDKSGTRGAKGWHSWVTGGWKDW